MLSGYILDTAASPPAAFAFATPHPPKKNQSPKPKTQLEAKMEQRACSAMAIDLGDFSFYR